MTVVNYLPQTGSVLRENFRKRLNRARYRRALEKKWRRLGWFPGLFYYVSEDPRVPDLCERLRVAQGRKLDAIILDAAKNELDRNERDSQNVTS